MFKCKQCRQKLKIPKVPNFWLLFLLTYTKKQAKRLEVSPAFCLIVQPSYQVPSGEAGVLTTVSQLFSTTSAVAEDKSVAELVDNDGLVVRHLVGQQLLREVVEEQLLDGTLHGTGTEVGVVAFLG